MDAKSDIFVETLKLMAAFISGFTVLFVSHLSWAGQKLRPCFKSYKALLAML